MSMANHWRELIATPAACPTDNPHEQTWRLERLACLAECQGERLDAGIAAIGELLDGAASAGQVDDGVAVDICSMLAALAGLSAQLAAVSRTAHSAMIGIRAPSTHSPTVLPLSLVSQE